MKTAKTRRRKASESKFENRIRFNWGYHDAKDGMYEASGRNSEEAWNAAVSAGLVSE